MIIAKYPWPMVRPRHLKRAPITEALIDFRVKKRAEFKVQDLRRLKQTLTAEFPVVEEQFLIEGGISLKPGDAGVHQFVAADQLNGYFFKSEDGLNIAQFRSDGFTFNKLAPYTSWEELFPKVWKLWLMYIQTGAAEFVTRVAVRYINKLTIPTTTSDLGVYLTVLPVLPAGISGQVSNFLTRFVLKSQDDCTANITEAIEKGDDPKSLTVILDIDVFKVKEFELDDPSIHSTFDALHDLKNRIFFSSITEETARLCE